MPLVLENSTSHKLQLYNNAAGSLKVTIEYARTDTSTPPAQQDWKTAIVPTTAANTGTLLDLLAGVASPGRFTLVKSINVRNDHPSVAQGTCKIIKTDGTTPAPLNIGPLAAGEGMGIDENGMPWRVDTNGGLYLAGVPQQFPSLLVCPMFATASLTGTKTLTSGTAFAVYLGKATKSISSAQLRYNVTTAMATITWGELAIAKGSINIGGNPTLTVVGYADISAVANSTGRKSTTVNVSSGQSINAGDDLWAIIGNSATTAAVVRAPSMADDIQVGVQASVASRPSTIVGTPTAFTIEGATTLAPWIAALI